MSNNECTKCIHHPVCKTAESCDGYVSGCEHFVVISNLETTTNADRIRAMSDEELAKWLCSISTAECCDRSCPARDICDFHDNGMIKWLKQPADMRGEEDG